MFTLNSQLSQIAVQLCVVFEEVHVMYSCPAVRLLPCVAVIRAILHTVAVKPSCSLWR